MRLFKKKFEDCT